MGNVRIRKLGMRKRRHLRIRKKITGTAERPRLSVNRSLKHIEAQLIDDSAGRSLVGLSSNSAQLRETLAGIEGKMARGREVGRQLAARAREAGIQRVVFDRGGYLYHGRVKALAEGAREGGLQF